MDVNTTLASRLYETMQGALRAEPGADRASAAETAHQAAANFVDLLRKGEEASQAGMLGQADPQSVVTALASAEMAVRSAVSIRDKVVESYQQILQMPV